MHFWNRPPHGVAVLSHGVLTVACAARCRGDAVEKAKEGRPACSGACALPRAGVLCCEWLPQAGGDPVAAASAAAAAVGVPAVAATAASSAGGDAAVDANVYGSPSAAVGGDGAPAGAAVAAACGPASTGHAAAASAGDDAATSTTAAGYAAAASGDTAPAAIVAAPEAPATAPAAHYAVRCCFDMCGMQRAYTCTAPFRGAGCFTKGVRGGGRGDGAAHIRADRGTLLARRAVRAGGGGGQPRAPAGGGLARGQFRRDIVLPPPRGRARRRCG